MEIEIVQGVEGRCVSVNNTRIVGNKPWGGGTVIDSWKCSNNDIEMLYSIVKKEYDTLQTSKTD